MKLEKEMSSRKLDSTKEVKHSTCIKKVNFYRPTFSVIEAKLP